MEHQSLSGMIYGLVKFFLLSFLVSTVLLQTQGYLSNKLCSLKTWIVSSIYPFHRLLMINCWTWKTTLPQTPHGAGSLRHWVQVAHDQLLDLHPFIQSVSYDPERKDVWTFIWGNATYSSRKYYKMVFQNYHPSPIFKKIWKSKCTPRLKFFAWLLFVDRLNTRNMLVKRHFQVQPNSFLCPLYNKHWWRFGPSLFQLSFCCCLLAKTGFSMGVHTEYKWTCPKPHGYYWNTFLHGNIHLCCLGIMEASKLKDFLSRSPNC